MQRSSRCFAEPGPGSAAHRSAKSYALRCVRGTRELLRLAVLVVLREERPEVAGFLLVLDPGEHHFGAGDLGLGILDVVLEGGFIPGDAGILVGLGIGIALRGAGFAAFQPVEFRADLVFGAFADCVAGQALVEGGFAGGDILRQ